MAGNTLRRMEIEMMEAHQSPTGVTQAPPARSPQPCVLGPARHRASFVVATEWLDNGVPVVSVTGDLDMATAPALEDPLLAACDHTEGPVAVDLARCGFIDLRGLHILLAAQERLERVRRELVLITGNPSVLRILQITRVDGLFEIHPSRAAATGGSLGA